MIDRVTQQNLKELTSQTAGPRVSFYLPTEKSGREIYKGATELQNLLRIASSRLRGHWSDEKHAKKFFKPITELIDSKTYWRNAEEGLAIFLSEDGVRQYRLPTPFLSEVFISDRFFVRPLLPTIGSGNSALVLALSKNGSRLFEANESGLTEIKVTNMPDDIRSSLNLVEPEKVTQPHTASQGFADQQTSVYHGQGGKPDTKKKELENYLRLVNDAVVKRLSDRKEPMVLACVGVDASVYRKVNSYPNLIDSIAAGATERLSEAHLFEKVLPVIQPFLFSDRTAAIRKYSEQANTCSEVSELVAAAYAGRVESLLVDASASISGAFDPTNQTVDYKCSTEDCARDLVEETIAATLSNSGEVFSVPTQDNLNIETMAATLRY